jgi:hypothetical protein
MSGLDDVRAAYTELLVIIESLDEAAGWQPTGCAGWTVRDLVFHLFGDAQRALVALGTPTGRVPDVDAASYWQGWLPSTEGAARSQRTTRIMASVWTSVTSIAQLYAETARAVLVQSERADPAVAVATQGHAITIDDLLSTLATEATLHHLDLVQIWDAPGPSAEAARRVTDVLDRLLGPPAPLGWEPVRWALVGTGRARATIEELAQLKDAAGRLPLFG